jgi:hypothetical protein
MAVCLMGKMDQIMNFRCDEEFADWVLRASVNVEMSKSEFIRECLLLGYAALKEKYQRESLANSTRLAI